MLDIPSCMLPEVRPSSEVYGTAGPAISARRSPLPARRGSAGCAFGQTCFQPGEAKNTYGTGCFILMNVGDKPVRSRHGLVTTIAWGLGGKVQYALEGSVFVAGAAIQWLRDENASFGECGGFGYLAKQVPDTHGCYVVPAFTGLGGASLGCLRPGVPLWASPGASTTDAILSGRPLDAWRIRLRTCFRPCGQIPACVICAEGGPGALRRTIISCRRKQISGDCRCCVPGAWRLRPWGAAYPGRSGCGRLERSGRGPSKLGNRPNLSAGNYGRGAAAELQGWNRAVQCSRNWAREEEAWMQ